MVAFVVVGFAVVVFMVVGRSVVVVGFMVVVVGSGVVVVRSGVVVLSSGLVDTYTHTYMHTSAKIIKQAAILTTTTETTPWHTHKLSIFVQKKVRGGVWISIYMYVSMCVCV